MLAFLPGASFALQRDILYRVDIINSLLSATLTHSAQQLADLQNKNKPFSLIETLASHIHTVEIVGFTMYENREDLRSRIIGLFFAILWWSFVYQNSERKKKSEVSVAERIVSKTPIQPKKNEDGKRRRRKRKGDKMELRKEETSVEPIQEEVSKEMDAKTDDTFSKTHKEVWREVKVARDQAEKAELKGTNNTLKEEDRHRILRLVLTVVIPDLRRLMVSTDSDKNQVVRSGVAVVLVQLLLHLPPKVMDMYIYLPSLIPSYLPGITQTVVLLLKQRLQSARDQARHTCNFLEGI